MHDSIAYRTLLPRLVGVKYESYKQKSVRVSTVAYLTHRSSGIA